MTNYNIIVVDDERTFKAPSTPITYLRSADEALAHFAKMITHNCIGHGDLEVVDELWLDHDLGDGQDVMPVAQFLYAMGFRTVPELVVKKVFIHTQNPAGALYLMTYCQGFCNDVTRVPLPDLA